MIANSTRLAPRSDRFFKYLCTAHPSPWPSRYREPPMTSLPRPSSYARSVFIREARWTVPPALVRCARRVAAGSVEIVGEEDILEGEGGVVGIEWIGGVIRTLTLSAGFLRSLL